MKNMIAVLLLLAVSTTGFAQSDSTSSTRTTQYGDKEIDYIDQAPVLGLPHDAMKMALLDADGNVKEMYWKAKTIYGFYFGAQAGVGVDFGLGKKVPWTPSYAVNVHAGYSGEKMDLQVTLGSSLLANPYVSGEIYPDFTAFFEPSVVLCRWGKDTANVSSKDTTLVLRNPGWNQFYLGALLGVQDRKLSAFSTYSDEFVDLTVDNSGRSAGLAFGVKVGYKRRFFMNDLRLGVEARFFTYYTTYSNEVVVNNVTTTSDIKTDWRFQVQLGITVDGLISKTARSYR